MSQTHELSPAGSIEREDDSLKDKKAIKSRRPPNTAFRQQRLKAWQPILTPKTVLPLLFCVGIIFAPIGGLLLWASAQVQEIIIDYTDCGNMAPAYPKFTRIPDGRVTSVFSASNSSVDNAVTWSKQEVEARYGRTGSLRVPTPQCSLQFSIPNDIGPPVFLYYRLTKFYQNHRRYVKSFDQQQLSGDYRSNSSIASSLCDPLTTNGTDGNTGFAYYPCGLIANSIFNDTIFSPVWLNVAGSNSKNQTYEMTDSGVGWSSDAALYGTTSYKPNEVAPPPYWQKRYPHGYDDDEFPIPNLHTDEAFWVWMRTAGLPTFSKLARRNDDTAMHGGRYQLDIYDDFPVQKFGGTKEILISTRTVMGGKNPFLGIAYVVIGGFCVLLGAIFTATHLIRPRKLGDHTYLTWNNEQPTATTTGRSLRQNEGA